MPDFLCLTRDFKEAAAKLREQMIYVAESQRILFAAPGYYQGDWRHKDGNNCYNFALHVGTRDFLQPGGLSELVAYGPPTTTRYIHEGALADGLIYMGSSFLKCPRDHFPVALFLEDEEDDGFHWFALRQHVNEGEPTGRYIWCHKSGERAAAEIMDPDTIFSIASKEKYPVFAGYYAVPHELTYFCGGKRRVSTLHYT